MRILWQDIRYGFRMLVRNPGFTAAAVISMALGIGANSTIFSLTDAVLLSPLPVKNAEELVTVYSTSPASPYGQISYPDFKYFRGHNEVFTDVLARTLTVASLRTGDRTEFLWGESVSGNYFSVLGVQAALGRTFLPEEDRSPNSHPVVVISHGLWRRCFGSDPDLVGRAVKLNGHDFTVVGIMPRFFTGILRVYYPDFWVPLMMHSKVGLGDRAMLVKRSCRRLNLVGRLKPDITLEQAKASLEVRARQMAQAYPETNKELGVTMIPASKFWFNPEMRSALSGFLTILMFLVGLVLLIACANVVNLLLARNSARRREIAVRLAVGASRWRLIRQLLTESVLLSALGGGIGLIIAMGANKLLLTLKPPMLIPITLDLSLNVRILEWTLFLAVLTGVVSGLAPAVNATSPELVPLLKDDFARQGFHKSRLRSLIVTSQMATALVLLIAAGLLVRSYWNAQSTSPGFDTENRLVARIDVGTLWYSETQGQDVFRRLEERIKDLPGVEAVSWTSRLPLGIDSGSRGVIVQGHEPPPNAPPMRIRYNEVAPNYFSTMSIPLLKGRDFTARDDADAPAVVVINEVMAEQFWPGENPVGKRFRLVDSDQPVVEVIGVARTSKYKTLSESPRPFMHLPLLQHYRSAPIFLIRTAGNPKSYITTLRNIMREVDDNVPFVEIKTMKEHMHLALTPQRVAVSILTVTGAVALILAAVGIYGLVSYSVSQRTREIGIRMALGARYVDVVKVVLRQVIALVSVGAGLGLMFSLVVGRFLSYLLYGVSATDPLTFGASILFLSFIALLACYIPARRAAKIDPMEALRYE